MVDLESTDVQGKVAVGAMPYLVPSEQGDLPGYLIDAFATKDGGQGIISASSANDLAHESTQRETTHVINETPVNIQAFIYDSAFGVGLLVLIWVFLSWTYPPINKKPRKGNLLRAKNP